MSVKLARYVFRRIRGRIVPIRKGIEVASKAVSELGDAVLKYNPQKSAREFSTATKKSAEAVRNLFKKRNYEVLGRGVDFRTFTKPFGEGDSVLKIPLDRVGTRSKVFVKNIPETADKLAVSRVLNENLPNYGIPTLESKIVRLHRKIRGLVQDKAPEIGASTPYSRTIIREADKIFHDTGLNLDAHSGNITPKGYLTDTGASLAKSKFKKVKFSDTAQELLGLKDAGYNATLKQHFNKSEMITESVASSAFSKKAYKKFLEAKKKGFRLTKSYGDELKLISPTERIAAAEAKGITFKKVGGKIKIQKPRKP